MTPIFDETENQIKPKILIIDDEKRVRSGCRKVLSEDGYEVFLAETGDAGLKMIEDDYYDVVLLDLMMPGISGFDLLAHVKTIHPETVFIVITGYATLEHSIEAMKKGAFDFIPKPFTPDQLRMTVAKAIEFTRTLKDIATEKTRIRTLINHLTDGVLATDTQKNIVLANPAFQRMIGYSGERPIGLHLSALTQHEPLHRLIDETLAIPKDTFGEQVEELSVLNQKGAAAMMVSAKCLPFRDRAGRNLGTVTVFRDITALKEMNQMKSDFVSMVSHEIRSPLGSVVAQLKLLQDELVGGINDKQRNILKRASLKLVALADLTTDLLDLAKIESGLVVLKKEPLNMAFLLKEQVMFHTPAAQEKHIQIKLEPILDLPVIPANKGNMDEVLSNLITNAIKYSPEGGCITISARIENDYFVMSVQDTGFGIPTDEQPRVFDRFYRVKNTDTRMIVGTGLGLPIVKNIVEAHDGMIKLESVPGKGSVFHVYLPVLIKC